MIKIFFITFFGAELIIATAIIMKIIQFDLRVNKWNDFVLTNRIKLDLAFVDSRLVLRTFTNNIIYFKRAFFRKRQEYLIGLAKSAFVYFSLLFAKGKYRNAVFAYQLIKEICCELNEQEI